MKIIKYAVLAMLAFGSFVGVSSAEVLNYNPFVSVEYKYYTVKGKSISAIRADIKRRSTARWGKRKRISSSAITSKMEYKYSKKYGTCKLREGKAYNHVVQILPKLKDPSKVSKQVKDKFDAYVKKLKKYEREAIEFRIKAAQDVKRYFKREPSAPCNKFEPTIKVGWSKIYDTWDKKMNKYISSTKQPIFK